MKKLVFKFSTQPDPRYAKVPHIMVGLSVLISFGFTGYFFLNKDKIAAERVEEYEQRTGKKYGEVKFD